MEAYDFPITNPTMDLADCRDAWFLDETYRCWCLEDVLYTEKATTPKFQRLSIFVPEAYFFAPGQIDPAGRLGRYTARTAPVVFENNSAGYMQMPHTWLGGPRCEAEKYLERGMVYVTCGCRGRDSRNAGGELCAQAPWTLVDLKTAIRFLRHNAAALPGDMEKLISVGFSAGGAMSALLGVSGNSLLYEAYLRENGAFMDERDDVFAAQVYCPITDLEHADAAYEWQFGVDEESEPGPSGPGGRMSEFPLALSKELRGQYIDYFNSLELEEDGTALRLEEDGTGSGERYLLSLLEEAAGKWMRKLAAGELPQNYSPEDYISGNYLRTVRDLPFGKDRKKAADQHHAGPDAALPQDERPKGPPPSLGDMLSRPPKGVPYKGIVFPMREVPGTDKRAWLCWDGERASITSLDDYLLNHRRRQKPCTAFDALGMDSAENQEFGTPEKPAAHFSAQVLEAVTALRERYPAEAEAFLDTCGEPVAEERRALLNPMTLLDRFDSERARHFRLRTGAMDADTSFMISLALALKLRQKGIDVDYALVWDQPHCEADYPGEVCDWIDAICKGED